MNDPLKEIGGVLGMRLRAAQAAGDKEAIRKAEKDIQVANNAAAASQMAFAAAEWVKTPEFTIAALEAELRTVEGEGRYEDCARIRDEIKLREDERK